MKRYCVLAVLLAAATAGPAACLADSLPAEADGLPIAFEWLQTGMDSTPIGDAGPSVADDSRSLVADWPCIGGDPGLSKYSPINIPADTNLRLQYKKRFYGKYTSNKGNFFYGSSVVTHGGTALVIADDRSPSPSPDNVSFMTFDWATGQGIAYHNTPWPFWENTHEVDSHHYSGTVVWHTDGRVYMRRGGDNNSIQVYLPEADQLLPIYNRDAQGNIQSNGIDANAFLQAYKDLLVCRFGHTFLTGDYTAGSISEACFVMPNQLAGQPDVLGKRKAVLGPSVPEYAAIGPDGIYGTTSRYGDIPKCANDVCVLAAVAYSTKEIYPNNVKVWLQATDLLTAQTLWSTAFTSDSGGAGGFGTSVSDYWRFIATDSGHYVFFTRAGLQPVTVRALDLRTGTQVWSMPLQDAQERPLLAYHDGCLYVVGRSDQYKLDINTGREIWHATNAWPHDKGYILGNHDTTSNTSGSLVQDPLYRPVVLTDETLWFVDGDGTASSYIPTAATLIAIRTSDGKVTQQIDLKRLCSGSDALLTVNDLMVSDGLIGVLIGVRNGQSSHLDSNGMDYQDLYVYKPLYPADANGDGCVDVVDLLMFVGAWATQIGDPSYDPAVDFNGDGTVDAADLLILADFWGQ